jgi:hypothetical protein
MMSHWMATSVFSGGVGLVGSATIEEVECGDSIFMWLSVTAVVEYTMVGGSLHEGVMDVVAG